MADEEQSDTIAATANDADNATNNEGAETATEKGDPEIQQTVDAGASETGGEKGSSKDENSTESGSEDNAGNKCEGEADGVACVEDYWPLGADNLLAFPRRNEIFIEYFMGGLERFEKMKNFLKSLYDLNGEGKPAVQFRVLTRGYADSTNAFLKSLGLRQNGRHIHSVWDTHGQGFDGEDKPLEFDESVHGEAGCKLDMIEVFASEVDASRVLFAEDMRPHDKMTYEAWIEEADECAFECKLVPLPYEAEGLSVEQLNEVADWVMEQHKAGETILVVFDFDCTVTANHFFKSVYWLTDRYHAELLRWLPPRFFKEKKLKEEIMKNILFS